MRKRHVFELALWRAACRHIDLAGSIDDLFEAIRTAVAIEGMWIFTIQGSHVTLVARAHARIPAAGADGPGEQRYSIAGSEARRAERFAARGGVSPVQPDRPGNSLLRGLLGILPDGLLGPHGKGATIAGGLQLEGRGEGVVLWQLADRCACGDAIAELLAATLEPLSVALETSRRFHELEGHRRSAEADRQAALRRLGRQSLAEPIIGVQSGLRPIMDRVAMVAPQDLPVLILGETGSGKEVIARAIHEQSDRHDGPFLRVNCGALPPELIDSHLFGHEKGAFSGAIEQRRGWFERADGGTLFLDEVGELPPAAQVRMLRVVQEGLLERVGGQQSVRVDCRIVAATHRDLAAMVRDRTFREDLWYRLAVFPLLLPPLRDRLEDLPELVAHLAERAATRFGLPPFEIRTEDLDTLAAYPWPGNIRELAAVIDRAALLGSGHRLAIGAAMGLQASPDPGPAPAATGAGAPHAIAPLREVIRAAIMAALAECRGRIDGPGGAAALLDINPSTLRSKMRKLGIKRDMP
ncbi:MAG: sigma-54-dependent Fis family transcriptional regulator [Phycisphaeraceae bacterium]|nr:sigma-54-dependent Fis family transcriptional regulator [Phycisphaeraceae bacterium]